MAETTISQGSMPGIKAKVVKGEENRFVSSNIDANMMAQLEVQRIKQEEQSKRQKNQSFMNSTRLNASKLYKEQCEKNMQELNSKKQQLQKKKQLINKYSIVPKKSQQTERNIFNQQVRKISKETPHTGWKQAENSIKNVYIPVDNCEVGNSSADESGFDSEVQPNCNQTPEQVSSLRQKVRNQMMDKCNPKKM